MSLTLHSPLAAPRRQRIAEEATREGAEACERTFNLAEEVRSKQGCLVG